MTYRTRDTWSIKEPETWPRWQMWLALLLLLILGSIQFIKDTDIETPSRQATSQGTENGGAK